MRQVFHGDMTGDLNEAQKEMMLAHELLKEQAKVGDGSDGLFWLDPMSKDGQVYAAQDSSLHPRAAPARRAGAYPDRPGPRRCSRAAKDIHGHRCALQSCRCVSFGSDQPARDGCDRRARTGSAPHGLHRPQISAGRRDRRGLSARLRHAHDHRPQAARGRSPASSPTSTASMDASPTCATPTRCIRDLYQQAWLRSNRPYALRPVLEHYDYTIGLWLARSDKIRTAQRQWADSHTLPTAAELGIPAPPPVRQLH